MRSNKHKRSYITMIVAIIVLAVMPLNAMAARIPDENTNQIVQPDLQQKAKKQFIYRPGAIYELNRAVDFPQGYGSVSAYAEGIGELYSDIGKIKDNPEIIRVVIMPGKDIKKGVYPVSVKFTWYEYNSQGVLEAKEKIYNDTVEIIVEKDVVRPRGHQLIYEPGSTYKFDNKVFFPGGTGCPEVYVEGIGKLEAYQLAKDGTAIIIPYDKDIKAGVYPMTLKFPYRDLGIDNISRFEEQVFTDTLELVVEEDIKGVHHINTVVDYDGTKDAVFRFQNGTGKNRIVEIQGVDFSASPSLDESELADHMVGFVLYDCPDLVNYFTYDLNEGEFRIKKEFFETRVNEFGRVFDPWVFGGGLCRFKLANGNVIEIHYDKPDKATLTKDFVNPGDDRWYLLYNVNETGGQTDPQPVDPVKEFVKRLYKNILQRDADEGGLNAWTDVLKSGREQGAKVAQGFFESKEFKERILTDEQYLEILYQTFFNRSSDPAGLKAWLGVLDSGLSRRHVLKGFAESEEFTKICNEYGIIRGHIKLTAPMDQNEGVTKFIVRCYRLCLGRQADEAGLNAWCDQILKGKNTAKQAASGFVFSEEFKKRNLTDTDYVKTMYRVFMDREADPSGLNAWVNVLKNGESREHVFNGFADSIEFKEICARYGIK